MLHENFENQVRDTKYINYRTIELQKSKPTHLINIYAPDTKKPQAEMDRFL